MMSLEHPSDCHPDLTYERLQALAQFFASTRAKVVALHEPLNGDDAWALGCRGFARWRNQLLKKHMSGEWAWLKIINPGKKFIFSIGSVPVRFYRGSLKNPPQRSLAVSFEEARQMSLAFPDHGNNLSNLKWRFAITTDYLGLPTKVIFAGFSSESQVAAQWEIPFDMTTETRVDLAANEDMVQLPAPKVSVFTLKKKDASNNGD